MHIHTYFLYFTGICHTINPTNQIVKSDPLYLDQIDPLELELSVSILCERTGF